MRRLLRNEGRLENVLKEAHDTTAAESPGKLASEDNEDRPSSANSGNPWELSSPWESAQSEAANHPRVQDAKLTTSTLILHSTSGPRNRVWRSMHSFSYIYWCFALELSAFDFVIPVRRDLRDMAEARVVEIVHVPVKQGMDVNSIMLKLAAISSDVPGRLSQYWGLQLEDQTTLDVIVEWQSLELYKAFSTSKALKPLLPLLENLADPTRASEVSNIPSSPELDQVLAAPVVEICRFKNVPETFEEKVTEFREEGKKLDVQKGVVNGWVIGGKEGAGGEMVALVGWESAVAHKKAMESEKMKEAMGKAKNHMGDVSLHHVVLTKFVK
ncbi:hypothetical protein BKA64DRAFT_739218 [Cadophora sp. MPI-SDFR-AT-0126]|nr:hypothetical protein BKA64DRAFT_739218 [Leotiomycetes sp. MPI-SDFR-AT-0126]